MRLFTFQNVLLFFVFPLVGALLIPYFQYELTPDGISYISIAEKYISGNFSEAINGYWAPLMSWTLIPFLLVKIPPIIAFKIHSLIVILLVCYTLKKLGKVFTLKELYINFLLCCSYLVILPYLIVISVADLLLLLILLLYFLHIFSDNYRMKGSYGIICGFIGAFAYLSKSYAFYFFLAHFIVFNLFLYVADKNSRKKVFSNFLSGLATFILLSSVWISILSYKYERFTISTAGKYNYFLKSPGQTGAQVMEYGGFFAPANSTAVSVWEDPNLLPMATWNPFASQEDCIHLIKNIYHNVLILNMYLAELSPLIFAIIIGLVFYVLRENSFKKMLGNKMTWILITAFLYFGGYCLILMERRYMLPAYLLLILAGAIMLQHILEHALLVFWKKILLMILIVLSFAYQPYLHIWYNLNRGEEEAMYAKEMSATYKVRGNVAMDSSWYKSLFTSYHMKCQYYGIPERNISQQKLEEDLKRMGINYYIDWTDKAPDFKLNFEEITKGREADYKIYKVQ